MNDPEQLKYQIALSLVPAIGFVHAKRLVAAFGSAKAVLKAPKKQLQKVPNIGEFIAQKVVSSNVLEQAEAEVEFIEKHRISYASFWDENYPKRLKRCIDAPLVLFWKGNIDFNVEKMVAIVGTRNATTYGREFCDTLIQDMASRGGYCVVSGLAYGIDVAAHKASLKHGVSTLGVLGHGLDMIYPNLHKQIAVKMLKDGGLVTDFVSGTSVERQNFLRRNRIVAGLTDATIIVESAEKGGALVTADIADSYNRDVFALPGRSSDPFSKGCNQLIKSQKAMMIEEIDDLEYVMGWQQKVEKPSRIQKQLFVELSDEEQKIMDELDGQELYIDQLCANVNMQMGKVSSALLSLEFKGLVASLPGKMYKRT